MSRNIYLIAEGGVLTELREQPYDSEALLQQLLADHPSVLTGDTVAGGRTARWLLVTREVDVPDSMDGGARWAVDHVFLDQNAVPTLVEVKRSSDTRIRREVVGQMLDYAANAVVYWPVDKLRTTFEARCVREGRDADAELAAVLAHGALDPDVFWQRAKTNLQAGHIRMVFVADVIPPELRRVVEFLNEQMDPAEVLAIEVRQYVAGGMRTLVPTLLGQTAEAQQRKAVGGGSSSGTAWDVERFRAHLRESAGEEAVAVADALLEWTERNGGRLTWGRGTQAGSFVPVFRHAGADHYPFAVWSSGTLEIYFQWLAARPAFADEEPRRALAERLNAIPGVRIPAERLRARPNVPLAAFAAPEHRAALLAIWDGVLAQIRSTA